MGLDHDRGCDVIWNELKIPDQPTIFKQLSQDFKSLEKLKHEYINPILDSWLQKDKLVFMTESWVGSSIRAYLARIGAQKKKVIKNWIIMILKGLKYLHSNNHVYKYLNNSKLLYNPNSGKVSIGDLFICSPHYTKEIIYENSISNNSNSYEWICPSPEVIKGEVTTPQSDVFSLGMIILEMLTLELPYSRNLKKKGYNNYLKNKETKVEVEKLILSGVKPSSLEKLNNDEKFKQFISDLIQYNYNDRPTIDELLESEFLEEDKIDDNKRVKLIRNKKRKNENDVNNEIEMKNFLKYYVVENPTGYSSTNIQPHVKKKFWEKPYDDELGENSKKNSNKDINDDDNRNSIGKSNNQIFYNIVKVDSNSIRDNKANSNANCEHCLNSIPDIEVKDNYSNYNSNSIRISYDTFCNAFKNNSNEFNNSVNSQTTKIKENLSTKINNNISFGKNLNNNDDKKLNFKAPYVIESQNQNQNTEIIDNKDIKGNSIPIIVVTNLISNNEINKEILDNKETSSILTINDKNHNISNSINNNCFVPNLATIKKQLTPSTNSKQLLQNKQNNMRTTTTTSKLKQQYIDELISLPKQKPQLIKANSHMDLKNSKFSNTSNLVNNNIYSNYNSNNTINNTENLNNISNKTLNSLKSITMSNQQASVPHSTHSFNTSKLTNNSHLNIFSHNNNNVPEIKDKEKSSFKKLNSYTEKANHKVLKNNTVISNNFNTMSICLNNLLENYDNRNKENFVVVNNNEVNKLSPIGLIDCSESKIFSESVFSNINNIKTIKTNDNVLESAKDYGSEYYNDFDFRTSLGSNIAPLLLSNLNYNSNNYSNIIDNNTVTRKTSLSKDNKYSLINKKTKFKEQPYIFNLKENIIDNISNIESKKTSKPINQNIKIDIKSNNDITKSKNKDNKDNSGSLYLDYTDFNIKEINEMTKNLTTLNNNFLKKTNDMLMHNLNNPKLTLLDNIGDIEMTYSSSTYLSNNLSDPSLLKLNYSIKKLLEKTNTYFLKRKSIEKTLTIMIPKNSTKNILLEEIEINDNNKANENEENPHLSKDKLEKTIIDVNLFPARKNNLGYFCPGSEYFYENLKGDINIIEVDENNSGNSNNYFNAESKKKENEELGGCGESLLNNHNNQNNHMNNSLILSSSILDNGISSEYKNNINNVLKIGNYESSSKFNIDKESRNSNASKEIDMTISNSKNNSKEISKDNSKENGKDNKEDSSNLINTNNNHTYTNILSISKTPSIKKESLSINDPNNTNTNTNINSIIHNNNDFINNSPILNKTASLTISNNPTQFVLSNNKQKIQNNNVINTQTPAFTNNSNFNNNITSDFNQTIHLSNNLNPNINQINNINTQINHHDLTISEISNEDKNQNNILNIEQPSTIKLENHLNNSFTNLFNHWSPKINKAEINTGLQSLELENDHDKTANFDNTSQMMIDSLNRIGDSYYNSNIFVNNIHSSNIFGKGLVCNTDNTDINDIKDAIEFNKDNYHKEEIKVIESLSNLEYKDIKAHKDNLNINNNNCNIKKELHRSFTFGFNIHNYNNIIKSSNNINSSNFNSNFNNDKNHKDSNYDNYFNNDSVCKTRKSSSIGNISKILRNRIPYNINNIESEDSQHDDNQDNLHLNERIKDSSNEFNNHRNKASKFSTHDSLNYYLTKEQYNVTSIINQDNDINSFNNNSINNKHEIQDTINNHDKNTVINPQGFSLNIVESHSPSLEVEIISNNEAQETLIPQINCNKIKNTNNMNNNITNYQYLEEEKSSAKTPKNRRFSDMSNEKLKKFNSFTKIYLHEELITIVNIKLRVKEENKLHEIEFDFDITKDSLRKTLIELKNELEFSSETMLKISKEIKEMINYTINNRLAMSKLSLGVRNLKGLCGNTNPYSNNKECKNGLIFEEYEEHHFYNSK